MKFRPSLVLALISLVLFSATSCTKKYTCHCDFKYTGAPGLPDSNAVEWEITDTKSKAETICKGESKTFDKNNIHTVETCYLY